MKTFSREEKKSSREEETFSREEKKSSCEFSSVLRLPVLFSELITN
jgi:hypothetical protein